MESIPYLVVLMELVVTHIIEKKGVLVYGRLRSVQESKDSLGYRVLGQYLSTETRKICKNDQIDCDCQDDHEETRTHIVDSASLTCFPVAA
jgi:hypothetical protein